MSRNTDATPSAPLSVPLTVPLTSASSSRLSKDFALITTFAAIITMCALLPAIKLAAVPAPITLQTFGVMLAGLALGPRRGFVAVSLYLFAGAIGLPVFSGGSGGFASFVGPTAGYLISFPLLAAAVGFVAVVLKRSALGRPAENHESTHRSGSVLRTIAIIAACLVSSYLITHLLGIFGMAWRVPLPLHDAFAADAIFIPGDVIKTVSAVIVAQSLWRAFPQLGARAK